MATKLMSNFEHLLKCPGCSANFSKEREPRQLRCSHDICTVCINQLIDGVKTQGLNTISCPKCDTVVDIYDAKHSSVNLFIQNIATALVEITEATADTTCEVCDKNKVSLFCQDCTKSYCSDCCKIIHKILKHHKKIYKLEDMDECRIIDCISAKKDHCPIINHEEKIIDYFCEECQELACVDCTVVKHDSHTKLVINAAASDKRSLIEDKSNLLKEESDAIKLRIDKLVAKKETLSKEHEQTKIKILKQANDIIDIVNQEKNKKLDNLKCELDELSKKIALSIKELQLQVCALEKYIEENKVAIQFNNPTMLLRKIQSLTETSNLIEKTTRSVESCSIQLDYNVYLEMTNECVKDMFGNCVISEIIGQLSLEFDPRGIAVTKTHCIVSSNLNNICKTYTFDGNTIASLPMSANDVAINQQIIHITNDSQKIHQFDLNGDYITSLKMPSTVFPRGLAFQGENMFVCCASTKQLYVTKIDDNTNNRKYVIDEMVPGTNNLKTFEQKCEPPISFTLPSFLAANSQLIIISDNKTHQVHAFKFDGQHIFTYGTGQPGTDDGQLYHPWGVCCHDDHIIIADCVNHRLVVLSDKGKLLGYIKCQGMYVPKSVAMGEDGFLRVAHGYQDGPWFLSTIRYKLIY